MAGVNRVAVHLSALAPADPVAAVLAARAGGIDAIGLPVAPESVADPRWGHGAGSALLKPLIDALLVTRVTTLDVGRVELGAPGSVSTDDPRHRVLDLAARLGAQFVVTRAVPGVDVTAALADLCAHAAPFRTRPLLVPADGTPVATARDALAAVAGTTAGVVVDVVPSTADGDDLAELLVEAGDALGYVRVPVDELRPDMGAATSLLATLPPWVPVVVGAPVSPDRQRPEGAPLPDAPDLDAPDALTVARHGAFLTACRRAVDRLLIHPRALEAEGQADG